MEVKETLANLLANPEISRRDKILLILARHNDTPLLTSQIKKIAIENRFREVEKWNVADILGKSKDKVAKVKDGWILKANGQTYINRELLNNPLSTEATAKTLRHLLPSIKSNESRVFIEEAIRCLEVDAYKAAIVFSWVGAISVLFDYVIAHRLSDFNIEAKKRNIKWKTASTRDDLARMGEGDFLDILSALSILGKNVKEHLKNNCLNLRNSCGHPSSLKVGKHSVEAHIEFLILNVYAVF